jgi:L-idonate 5-dehydrogenase
MIACVIHRATDLQIENRPVFGTFRFHEEFQWAVQALASGRVNVDPILSAQFPFPDAVKAFELASDRRQAVKVSLVP